MRATNESCLIKFLFFNRCSQRERRDETPADVLHALPDVRTGEGIPLQSLPNTPATHRNSPQSVPIRATNQDLVPGKELENWKKWFIDYKDWNVKLDSTKRRRVSGEWIASDFKIIYCLSQSLLRLCHWKAIVEFISESKTAETNIYWTSSAHVF